MWLGFVCQFQFQHFDSSSMLCQNICVYVCLYVCAHITLKENGTVVRECFGVILGLASGHVSQLKEERLFTRIIISVFSASSQRIRPSGFGPSSLPVPAVRRVSVWCVPAFKHVLLIDVRARSPLQNNKISDKLEISCTEKRSVFVLTFEHFTAQPEVSLFYVESFLELGKL